MVDHLSVSARSLNMAAIRGRDTEPEQRVRSMLHRLGYRFRLHRHDLPGTPDIVFIRLKRVIFVHGCFWHGHPRCSRAGIPATHRKFWTLKIAATRERDQAAIRRLRRAGWRTVVVWQCELRQNERLENKLVRFLSSF
jgi:DNA mismatch endonuclease, patch repair protein